MAKALLAHGANVNARFEMTMPPDTPNTERARGLGPKHMAIGSYRLPFTGATPFFLAAMTSDVPFMRFLADNGADPSLKSDMGVTPLLAAAGIGFWEGEHPGTQVEAFDAVKLAYELGNDPKAVVDYGTRKGDPMWNHATAMHGAANRGAEEMVRWLAEKGVPLDTKSQRGISPWHIAAGLDGGLFHAWPQTAELIVAIGADQGVTIDQSDPVTPTDALGGTSARPSAAQVAATADKANTAGAEGSR